MSSSNADKFDTLIKSHKKRSDEATPTQPEAAVLEVPASSLVQETRGPGRPATGKRNSNAYRQITAFIRKDTRRKVDIALANRDQNKELSDALEEALTLWLQQQA